MSESLFYKKKPWKYDGYLIDSSERSTLTPDGEDEIIRYIYYFIDGKEGFKYSFNNLDNLFAFVADIVPAEILPSFLRERRYIENGGIVSFSFSEIAGILETERTIKTYPNEIKNLYYKYHDYSRFSSSCYRLFSHGSESDDSATDYIVYNWHTVPENKVFYLNFSRGSTDIERCDCERKSELEAIMQHYEVVCEIIAKNLDYKQAFILRECKMFEYTDCGEYILGTTAEGYRSYRNSLVNSCEDDVIQPLHNKCTNTDKIRMTAFEEHYLANFFTEKLEFDPVEASCLETVFILSHNEVTEDDSAERARSILKKYNTLIRKTLSKDSLAVIVTDYISYLDYYKYKSLNKKIFDSAAIEQFDAGIVTPPCFKDRTIPYVPKYDKKFLAELRDYLSKNSALIDARATRPVPFMVKEFAYFKDGKKFFIEFYARLKRKKEHPEEHIHIDLRYAKQIFSYVGAFDEFITICSDFQDEIKGSDYMTRLYNEVVEWRDNEACRLNKKAEKKNSSHNKRGCKPKEKVIPEKTPLEKLEEELSSLSQDEISERAKSGLIIRNPHTGTVICPEGHTMKEVSSSDSSSYSLSSVTCSTCVNKYRCNTRKSTKQIHFREGKNIYKISTWTKDEPKTAMP